MAATTALGSMPGASFTKLQPFWESQSVLASGEMRLARDVLGTKTSPSNWVLCGRSRITPVTVRLTIWAWQAASPSGQPPRPVVTVRPIGLASPKYLWAAFWLITTELGWRKTVSGSPATSGKRIIRKKSGSTVRTPSKNCRSPAVRVMGCSQKRVMSTTPVISSRMAAPMG